MIEKTILTLGDYGVGKTNLILRLTENEFKSFQIRTTGIISLIIKERNFIIMKISKKI